MRLRQAKKIMGWCKGEGNWSSKDRLKSFWRRCNKLRPVYYDEKRGVWVQPSCHDIDIIRRACTRLFRWIRNGKKLKNITMIDDLKTSKKELDDEG